MVIDIIINKKSNSAKKIINTMVKKLIDLNDYDYFIIDNNIDYIDTKIIKENNLIEVIY